MRSVNGTSRCLVLAAVLAAVALVGADENFRITPIVRDNQVLVSFDVADAYTPAVRDAIASGLTTTITYELQLRMETWVDRTIVSAIVSSSDHYDNLTRKHTLSRIVNGHVEESLVTAEERVAKTWLTSWTRLPLCDTAKLDPARDYYVRISARTRPFAESLLGFTKSITGQAKFTFIP